MFVGLFGYVRPGLLEGQSVEGLVLYLFFGPQRQPCHGMTLLCYNHDIRRMRLLLGEVWTVNGEVTVRCYFRNSPTN